MEEHVEQKRPSPSRAHVRRRLATIPILVVGTLLFEFLLLGVTADKTSWETALFWSGMLWIGIGALIGGGFADTATVSRMNPVASPITAETLTRNRMNEREKEMGSMLTMMMVGAVLLLLYFILTYVL